MNINIKLFYKTQRDLNTLIHSYWYDKITEDELIKTVINIFHNNKRKMLKNNDFTIVLKQQMYLSTENWVFPNFGERYLFKLKYIKFI